MKTTLLLLGLVLLASAATAQIDTLYIKTDWDTYVTGASPTSNYGTNTSVFVQVNNNTRVLTQYSGFSALLGDSMYFIAARHGLYGVSVFSATDLVLRKLCKRFVETEANFIYWATGLAWTNANVLGSLAECGDMNAGDSSGTNADDDYQSIASVSGSAWNWVPIDSNDMEWAMNGSDSLWFALYGQTSGGSVSFRSSDYTTDTTKTPRVMFIVGHFATGGDPGMLHHGDQQCGKHNGDRTIFLHKGDQ